MLRTLALALILALPASAEDQLRTISVTGTGTVAAAPDMAQVSLGVEARARTARDALSSANSAMASLMGVLEGAGIEGRDIQTTSLSLYPEYNNRAEGRQVTGYRASNGLSIRIRDIATTGTVLDALASAGANSIQSVSFAIAEPRPLQDDARRAAIADARRKAELYAGEAGVSLGPLISLAEHGSRAPRPQMMDARIAMEAAVPIAEGELTIEASISAVFEIAN